MRSWVRPDGRTFVVGEPDGELPEGELFATVDEEDGERRRSLEELGFVVERRELKLLLPTRLPRTPAPAGFALRRADEVPEDELRLLDDELRQDVPGTDGWRWTTADFHTETHESPDFDPAVYLVGLAPAGAPAAICRAWNRPGVPTLGFVGVRRTHRRRGVTRRLVGETNVPSRTLLEGIGGRRAGASLELKRPAARL